MKTQSENLEVKTSGNLKGRAFGFNFNAQMADALSKKIYTKPVLAVVREYMCNAHDAHVEVGAKDTPIEVKLPNRMSPYWSVRDNGRGLSETEIMGDDDEGGLFNTYGKSGKNHTNNQIGGFGMGSKAGFAYVDKGGNFTVTSFLNGRKSTYACHKGEDGIPVVTKMSEVDTNEPNGVEIKVPVRTDDTDTFAEYTAEIAAYLETEPKITGNNSHLVVRPKYKVKTDKWGLREFTDRGPYYNSPVFTANVVMGGVAYPIDYSAIKNTADVPIDGRILKAPIDLFLDIGDVNLQLSREGLSYDDFTVQALSSATKGIAKELGEIVSNQLASCTTLWEAAKLADNTIFGRDNRVVSNIIGENVFWKGKKVPPLRDMNLYALNVAGDIANFTQLMAGRKTTKIDWYSSTSAIIAGQDYIKKYKKNNYNNGSRVSRSTFRGASFNIGDFTPTFLFIDEPGKYVQKIKHNYSEGHLKGDIFLIKDWSKSTKARIKAKLGNPPDSIFKNVSDLEDAPVVPGVTRAGKRLDDKRNIKHLELEHYRGSCWSKQDRLSWWTDEENYPMSNGGVFVFIREGYVYTNKESLTTGTAHYCAPNRLKSFIDKAKKLGYLKQNQNVYGISRQYVKHVTDTYAAKWVNLFDLFEEKVKQDIADPDVIEGKRVIESSEALSYVISGSTLLEGLFTSTAVQKAVKCPIYRGLVTYIPKGTRNPRYSDVEDFIESVQDNPQGILKDCKFPKTPKLDISRNDVKNFLDKHPMLRYIDDKINVSGAKQVQDIINYLNREE